MCAHLEKDAFGRAAGDGIAPLLTDICTAHGVVHSNALSETSFVMPGQALAAKEVSAEDASGLASLDANGALQLVDINLKTIDSLPLRSKFLLRSKLPHRSKFLMRRWMGRASRALDLQSCLGTSRSLPTPWSTKGKSCGSIEVLKTMNYIDYG
jgi:hypothetical protein